MTTHRLAPRYDPRPVEQKWYAFWMEHGLFHAEPDPARRPYTVVIPPPNVTGILHLGHVLNNTIQDILIRWKRMQGYETLWMPGTDHAGIATQVVVERMLAERGCKREDLGRERFIEEVWKWRAAYGRTIIGQLQRLGCSCDWARERFTMDEGLSRAVRLVFVSLYKKGLIYRGNRIINWCPRCRTALSNEEAIPEEEQGALWVVRYPLADGTGSISVATTRPETMLGDTAVAVHPEDPRHAHLIGKTVTLPLIGREIPVIADAEFVDPEFGTGAVKVTPAHDPNDFLMGRKHGLPRILVMDEAGVMNAEAGAAYQGLDRFACRKAVVCDLDAQGLLERTEPYKHAVPHCQRCHTVLEPYLSDQWFARMKPLADRVLRALDDENLPRFTPEHWTKTYRHWLENIEDWCISRQLWWGHRIPVWYCDDCGTEHVAIETPTRCTRCAGASLHQDDDVLDTWFSSALWPFSTLGWPDQTREAAYFYPTSSLVTGHDIIFFWVARMVMMGYEFMGDRPFDDVYITSLVRDERGRKMSKSFGNSPDPTEVMEAYGADALRFAMILMAPQGQDALYSIDRVETGRNFTNKLWNAARFVLMHHEREEAGDGAAPETEDRWDGWILHRLQRTTDQVTQSLERFRFSEAAHALYDFLWHDYCDWYLEVIKRRLFETEESPSRRAARRVSRAVLEQTLRLLHPFIPFLTEEIWQHLRSPVDSARREESPQSIMTAPWPAVAAARFDERAEREVALLQELTTAIREVRADFHVPPATRMEVHCRVHDEALRAMLHEAAADVTGLANADVVVSAPAVPRPSLAASGVLHGVEFYVPLADLVDTGVEVERLSKERDRVALELEKVKGRLTDDRFIHRAPEEVVSRERDKQARYEDLLERLGRNLSIMSDDLSSEREGRPVSRT